MDALTASNPRQGGEKESERCSICLLPFDKQTVASLESCQHEFCLECILQWSQVGVRIINSTHIKTTMYFHLLAYK